MGVEIIYVVRHGHRITFTVDPSTGRYFTTSPTPTGIPTDPELAKYGVDQSKELAAHLTTLKPEIDVFYSSPFYRCIQTLKPTIEQLLEDGKIVKSVRVEPGVGEFFGAAPFSHPQPASLEKLEEHFGFINQTHRPAIVPNVNGETIEELHNRIAYAMHRIISDVDAEAGGPKVLLISTHAACMICLGRVLTGKMPEDPTEEDFRCGTCALSKFERRPPSEDAEQVAPVEEWSPKNPVSIPHVDWRNGKGVKGGWDCVLNGDCSFLKGGEERTWSFSTVPAVDEDAALVAGANASSDQQSVMIDETLHARDINVDKPPPGEDVYDAMQQTAIDDEHTQAGNKSPAA